MSWHLLRVGHVRRLIGVSLLVLGIQPASGDVFDFEAPTYSAGSVIGQDGWVTNNYVPGGFFGGPNGEFMISTEAPLAGTQSLRFNQTAVTGGGGSPGASDISKPEIIAISPGAEGPDLFVSYRYTGSGNELNPSSHGGVFVTPDAVNGWSPVFLEFRAGEVVTGDNFNVVLLNGFSYSPADILDVKYEVDLDAPQKVTYRIKNLTTGAPEFSQTLGFFAGWGPEGTNGEYLVDVGVVGRRGTVQYDNLMLVAIPEPASIALAALSLVIALRFRRRTNLM